jgi:hypothetical protein
MSDALEAVAKAVARVRQVAASKLVRKQELEEAIARLRAAGATDEQLEQETTELAAVTSDYEASLKELAELKKLGGQARVGEARATVAAATASDPLIQSPEEIALDNARAHIRDLDAQLKLEDELAPPAPAAAPAAPTEDPEETARKKFEELRANRPKKTF